MKINIMKRSPSLWAGRCFGPAVKSIHFAAALLLSAPAALTAQAVADNRVPDLPPDCPKIIVPEGNRVAFHVFAVGVQIYRWDGANWAFTGPEATLYADPHHHAQVGTHFGTPGGPAWQSNSGSRIVAQRMDACTPDATAIPWLLLRAVSREGRGIFSSVSYVQRVHTAGGLAPATPGAFVGEEMRVPYTAEYFFYRSTARRYQ